VEGQPGGAAVPGNGREASRSTIGIAALFLGFASFISLLAPIYVINLSREGQRDVHATVTQHLLPVVPIRTRTLRGLSGVTSTTRWPSGVLYSGVIFHRALAVS
jgi:hypothetical protein